MKEIIDKYENIIKNYEIITWDSEPTSYRFKLNLYFIDDSQLIIKDYLFPSGRKYSFHWQDKDGKLLIRWDNAMHWKDIETFPHHMHDKEHIFNSKEVTLEDERLQFIFHS